MHRDLGERLRAISWGIGEGIFPLIPDNSPEELATAYSVLTGQQPPVQACS